MPIKNLTKLTVRICDEDGNVFKTIEPDGRTVDLHVSGDEQTVDGVPVETTVITGIDNLPDEEDGTWYIVPQPVAYVVDRRDLVIPDTGPTAVRKEDGKVFAVRRLYSIRRER